MAAGPPRLYSPREPSLRMTRWHGTAGSTFFLMIEPTARAAPGFPARRATSAYAKVFPFGILATTFRTFSVNEGICFLKPWIPGHPPAGGRDDKPTLLHFHKAELLEAGADAARLAAELFRDRFHLHAPVEKLPELFFLLGVPCAVGVLGRRGWR